ncbi:MAG: TatD family hydrolase [Treponema sp.]|nr:TatD family hydrolase [Candidatus Treponema scatequi]
MYSDTHFHFHMFEESLQPRVLREMAVRDCFFGLDIGTHCDDLISRQDGIDKAIEKCAGLASDEGAVRETGIVSDESFKKSAEGLSNENLSGEKLKSKIKSFIRFSAGIWPAPEAIRDRKNQIEVLEKMIRGAGAASDDSGASSTYKKVVAIGECGLDHHWNVSGADGRAESDFDEAMFLGEREMFEAQLDMAKRMKLPVVVHSRDAFDGTLECIKNVGYDNGIIHCFSYGLDEARAFLERGWYLAFGGGVTYTKKSKMDAMMELLRFVPEERLLLETDAPYLAPVPFRGTPNNPLLIEHSYKFIAEVRGVSVESLCETVDSNIRKLFKM